MRTRIPKAGRVLRHMREERGLTLRDVQARSRVLAKRFHNPDFELVLSALWEIESKGKVPHVYRVLSLAKIYRCSTDQLLALYMAPGKRGRSRRR